MISKKSVPKVKAVALIQSFPTFIPPYWALFEPYVSLSESQSVFKINLLKPLEHIAIFQFCIVVFPDNHEVLYYTHDVSNF